MVLVPHGIRMPAGEVVASESLFEGDPMPRPYVVKPVNEGSSVGVAIVTDDGNYGNPIGRETEGPWKHFDELARRALHQGPRADRRRARRRGAGRDRTAAQVGLLRLRRQIYRRHDRSMSARRRFPLDIAEAAMAMALQAHRLLGCRGCSRSDFRWDDEQGRGGLYLLEVNTQPGMTPLSLVPEQAQISRHELCRARAAHRGGGPMSAKAARAAAPRRKEQVESSGPDERRPRPAALGLRRGRPSGQLVDLLPRPRRVCSSRRSPPCGCRS